jgi:hypothetical protein
VGTATGDEKSRGGILATWRKSGAEHQNRRADGPVLRSDGPWSGQSALVARLRAQNQLGVRVSCGIC